MKKEMNEGYKKMTMGNKRKQKHKEVDRKKKRRKSTTAATKNKQRINKKITCQRL